MIYPRDRTGHRPTPTCRQPLDPDCLTACVVAQEHAITSLTVTNDSTYCL